MAAPGDLNVRFFVEVPVPAGTGSTARSINEKTSKSGEGAVESGGYYFLGILPIFVYMSLNPFVNTRS